MKLYIPFREFEYVGGPRSFLKNLQHYLDSKEIYLEDNPWKATHIFFPIRHNIFKLIIFKLMGKKVIQRLDGIFLMPWILPSQFEWRGFKYHLKTFLEHIEIVFIYKYLADLVIFQSQYCKDLYFELVCEQDVDRYKIIYNGVDETLFFPSLHKKKSKKFVDFIMVGSFRRMDMIEPVIRALDQFDEVEFRLKVIGPVRKNLMTYLDRDYIDYVKSLDRADIAENLRMSDIFIFSSINPPCPNAVLEAIACGLPVVSFDYGSLRELCFFNKDLLASCIESKNNKLIKTPKDLSVKEFLKRLVECVTNYDKYRERALRNIGNFSFENTGREYYLAMKELPVKSNPKRY